MNNESKYRNKLYNDNKTFEEFAAELSPLIAKG
jgi:hypothetical protein